MALTRIQKEIMASIAGNRSDTSSVAGGLVLNMDWPRMSDDIDIFHDTDEEIGVSADTDIAKLEADGFKSTANQLPRHRPQHNSSSTVPTTSAGLRG